MIWQVSFDLDKPEVLGSPGNSRSSPLRPLIATPALGWARCCSGPGAYRLIPANSKVKLPPSAETSAKPERSGHVSSSSRAAPSGGSVCAAVAVPATGLSLRSPWAAKDPFRCGPADRLLMPAEVAGWKASWPPRDGRWCGPRPRGAWCLPAGRPVRHPVRALAAASPVHRSRICGGGLHLRGGWLGGDGSSLPPPRARSDASAGGVLRWLKSLRAVR